MRCYRLPGFQSRLLGELQRQQNNMLFCDILLQTEGVSVPAHGCVLAALSPYLSRKLSASPYPPAGQQRKVKLQALNAQTLLKLVGLLYSGLLEVNETTDQDDVLAAANQLGFNLLVERQEDVSGEGARMKQLICGRCREAWLLAEERKEREKCITCNLEMQVETKGKRDAETQVEGTGFVDAATQTIGAQSDVCPSSSSQNTSLPGVLGPSPTTALWDEMGSSKEVTKTTTTKSSAPRNTRVASELSNCIRPKQGFLQRNNRKTCTRETAGGGRKKEATGGQSTQTSGKEIRTWRGKIGGGKRSPRRLAAMGLAKTRKIAIKVKLRRVKQGAMWEVVHMRDIGQRLTRGGSQAVFAALKKDGAKILQTQAEGTKVQSTASTSQLCPVNKQQSPIMSLALPGQPPRVEVCTDIQSPSSLCYNPENNESMSALLSQAQCPVEESDREIEKLLEDIMMGLNILPPTGLEKDSNRSSFKSNSAPITSVPPILDWTARQGEVNTAVSVVGSHDYKTASEDTSSKDTGNLYFVTVHLSSSCYADATASATSVHYADTWPQTESESNQIAQAQSSLAQEQPESKDSSPHQGFTQCHSLKHKRQGDTMDQSILRSEPLDCQYLHTLKVASIMPDTVNFSSQETNRSALKELTWLSETPQVLQFPLSLGFKERTKPSEPCDLSRLESMEGQELLEPSHPSTEMMRKKGKYSLKKLCVKAAKEEMQSSSGRESLTGPISSCEHVSKSKDPQFKQCDMKDKPVISKKKRKCEAHTDDAFDHTLVYKATRHRDGEFSKIFLNMCSVSLSCNNVLSKERTLNKESHPSKEPQEVLDITDVDKGFKKLKADQTITKTKTSNTPHARSASKTKDKGDKIVENVPVIKRKPGRPPKKKIVHHNANPSTGRPPKKKIVPHNANPSTDEILESDSKMNVNAKIGEECQQNYGKSQVKRRSSIRNVDCGLEISNDEVHNVHSSDTILPSHAVSALNPESSPRVENKQLSETKRTAMVSLKEFKELIKFRHIKTRGLQTKTKVNSSEVEENVHFDGKTCDNTDRCDATSAETVIGLDILPTKNVTDVKFDQNQNQVIAIESQESQMDIPVSQNKKGNHSQSQKALDMANSTETPQDPVEDFTLCVSPSQQSYMTTDYPSTPETPNKRSRDIVGSRHFQEDEEEEMEVDILICSPDKGLQPIEFGGRVIVDTSPDEDEEELKEIDVIGI
ncbi:unnamed protein product [Lota lota]